MAAAAAYQVPYTADAQLLESLGLRNCSWLLPVEGLHPGRDAPTTAAWERSRFAALMHEEERATYEHALEALDRPLEVRRDLAAFALARFTYLFWWEGVEQKPSAVVGRALDLAWKLLEALADP